jgi:hypothetical protein
MRDKGIPLPGDYSATGRIESNLKKVDTVVLQAEMNGDGNDGGS